MQKILICLFAVLAICSCSEPPKRVHEKLETILQGDLKYMVAEIEKKSGKSYLIDSPYYEIRSLRFFHGDTANMYGAYAEVDFHYYKGIHIFQKRKYRYDAQYYFWDRYFKQLQFEDQGQGSAPTPVKPE